MSKENETPTIPPVRESSTTCVVGCKLPHGIKLELRTNDDKIVSHTLKGMNTARIVGGYGLTHGIPADFMDEWFRQNADHPAVKNGSIFMHNKEAGAVARAKEGRDVLTGLEAIDPLRDARAKRLELDSDAVRAYERQKAENPMRNRQIVE